MMARMRSLADFLRSRSDSQLCALLRLRPDLASPVPSSFSELAQRANSGTSTVAAIRTVDDTALHILEAICALEAGGTTATPASVSRELHLDSYRTERALAMLLGAGLLWGDERLHVPSAVRDYFGPYPCGLAPPHPGDPHAPTQVFDPVRPSVADELPTDLLWRVPRLAADDGQALALRFPGLLRLQEDATWLLPRTTALALREGRLFPQEVPQAPELVGRTWEPERVGQAAAHQADQFLRITDRLVSWLGRTPLSLLASGSLGIREAARVAAELKLDETTFLLSLTLALRGGMITADAQRRLVPTDSWHRDARSREARWWALFESWRSSTEDITESDEPAWRPLDGNARMGHARAAVLECLAQADQEISLEQTLAWLRWRHPVDAPNVARVRAALVEARTLGVSAYGVPANFVVGQNAAALASQLPQQGGGFLVQADFTVTAPAPLERALELRLSQVADFESGGGASVFRLSPESLRRAIADGTAAADILAFLSEHSMTPLPASVRVAITDASRSGERLVLTRCRTTISGTPDAIEQLRSNAQLQDVSWIRISDEVVATDMAVDEVGSRLARAGFPTAQPVTHRPEATEAPPVSPQLDPGRVVAALRTVEDARSAEGEPEPAALTTLPVSRTRLWEACRNGEELILTYIDDQGAAMTSLVQPLTLGSGDVCVLDRTRAAIHRVDLARIQGVTDRTSAPGPGTEVLEEDA